MLKNAKPTKVLFPRGSTFCSATVVDIVPHRDSGGALVFTDRTPFHPRDHAWPDQPGDRGVLRCAGKTIQIIDSITVAICNSTENMHVDSSIPVRRSEPGWTFHVGHVIAGNPSPSGLISESCELEVDAVLRHSLSAAHTACHLMSLALNQVTAKFWRKVGVETDARGYPNLDRFAIQSSHITPFASQDAYRLGKSIRKKGFNAADFIASLPDTAVEMTNLIRKWCEAQNKITLDAPDDSLTAKRLWTCQIEDHLVTIPCGGTHVKSLGDIGLVTVGIETGADPSTCRVDTRVDS